MDWNSKVSGAAGGRAGGGGRAGAAGGGAREGDGAGGGVRLHQRRRRSWVWNQFFVLEENTGDEPLYVGKLHSDVDRGDGRVRYILSGDGAMSVFTIDERTGDIHATKRLDREQQPYYTLRAQARDHLTNLPVEPESQFVIKVQDINDNEPKFLDGPYTAMVAERSPVGESSTCRPAEESFHINQGLVLEKQRTVLVGNDESTIDGQDPDNGDESEGVVRTALPDMDREVQDYYLLIVQAKDMIGQMGGLSGTTSVTVRLTDVNDNPPRFPRKSYQFRVPESTLVSAVVAKIKALDLDIGPNAEMDYRILDGDGLGTFRMITDPNTQEGLITLQKTLDFETKSSFTLRVEASNRYVDTRFLTMSPFSDVVTVRLLVENLDEPPVFSSSVSRMVISEAAPVGTDVGSVSAHDPDAKSSPIRYSIDWKSDMEHYFDVDSSSGVITTARPLDREVIALHNITVLAMESLDPSQVGKAVVLVSVTDVNDNAPSFAVEYETFVCENSQPGQTLDMSLENFFIMPKKRDNQKKNNKSAASKALANPDDDTEPELANEEEPESCTESACPTSDDTVVQQVTRNIKKMLDTTLDNILKPVTEMSEKLDKLVDRLGTVEQRVSDLEDNAAANAPRLDSVESELKKAMEKLENYENQSRRQNIRIIGLKEGTEGKDPPVFFEKWIPEVLNMDMQGERLKIERAHRAGPPLGSTGKQGLVRLHDYTDRQRILRAARNKGRVTMDGQVVSFYQNFSAEIVK
ncbi:cadherin-7-like [Epinephelus moara]|uniref:cadherin-7-like n=1 Tax=Epinephelus moara TaxID=300413 RepID=UPI00214E13CD|nr:cadherin-7-like [Epinephelus moara]